MNWWLDRLQDRCTGGQRRHSDLKTGVVVGPKNATGGGMYFFLSNYVQISLFLKSLRFWKMFFIFLHTI